MMYPYTTPQVMNDDIFEAYGGAIGDESDLTRVAAYQIAEQLVCEDLSTFLVPTIVTGSYAPAALLNLEHAHLNSVQSVKYYDLYGICTHTFTDRFGVDLLYGLVDLRPLYMYGGLVHTYRVEVAYNAGLASGSVYQPGMLLPLTMMSKILLNEILGFGNEAPGDIGVQRFSNQEYSETRVALLRTTFGSSAQAQLIHKLLAP